MSPAIRHASSPAQQRETVTARSSPTPSGPRPPPHPIPHLSRSAVTSRGRRRHHGRAHCSGVPPRRATDAPLASGPGVADVAPATAIVSRARKAPNS